MQSHVYISQKYCYLCAVWKWAAMNVSKSLRCHCQVEKYVIWNVVSYICSFSHWHVFYKPCLNPMHCINQHNKSKHWANIDMAEKVLMMLLVKFCNFLALFSTYYLLLPWCNVLWRPILPAERELKLLNFQNREQNKCDKQHIEILTFWGWDFKGVKIIVWGNSHFDGSRWNAREWPFKQKPLSISCTWYCL